MTLDSYIFKARLWTSNEIFIVLSRAAKGKHQKENFERSEVNNSLSSAKSQ